uniref:Uncharacterized protein n=1 Tax=Anopheles merus TaxID=30066 RepID=A0A182V5H2_ANOME
MYSSWDAMAVKFCSACSTLCLWRDATSRKFSSSRWLSASLSSTPGRGFSSFSSRSAVRSAIARESFISRSSAPMSMTDPSARLTVRPGRFLLGPLQEGGRLDQRAAAPQHLDQPGQRRPVGGLVEQQLREVVGRVFKVHPAEGQVGHHHQRHLVVRIELHDLDARRLTLVHPVQLHVDAGEGRQHAGIVRRVLERLPVVLYHLLVVPYRLRLLRHQHADPGQHLVLLARQPGRRLVEQQPVLHLQLLQVQLGQIELERIVFRVQYRLLVVGDRLLVLVCAHVRPAKLAREQRIVRALPNRLPVRLDHVVRLLDGHVRIAQHQVARRARTVGDQLAEALGKREPILALVQIDVGHLRFRLHVVRLVRLHALQQLDRLGLVALLQVKVRHRQHQPALLGRAAEFGRHQLEQLQRLRVLVELLLRLNHLQVEREPIRYVELLAVGDGSFRRGGSVQRRATGADRRTDAAQSHRRSEALERVLVLLLVLLYHAVQQMVHRVLPHLEAVAEAYLEALGRPLVLLLLDVHLGQQQVRVRVARIELLQDAVQRGGRERHLAAEPLHHRQQIDGLDQARAGFHDRLEQVGRLQQHRMLLQLARRGVLRVHRQDALDGRVRQQLVHQLQQKVRIEQPQILRTVRDGFEVFEVRLRGGQQQLGRLGRVAVRVQLRGHVQQQRVRRAALYLGQELELLLHLVRNAALEQLAERQPAQRADRAVVHLGGGLEVGHRLPVPPLQDRLVAQLGQSAFEPLSLTARSTSLNVSASTPASRPHTTEYSWPSCRNSSPLPGSIFSTELARYCRALAPAPQLPSFTISTMILTVSASRLAGFSARMRFASSAVCSQCQFA